MAKIVPFPKIKAVEQRRKKAKAHTLCKRGFHKWQIVTEQKFDVKKGRLVTLFRCIHCQKEKTKSI